VCHKAPAGSVAPAIADEAQGKPAKRGQDEARRRARHRPRGGYVLRQSLSLREQRHRSTAWFEGAALLHRTNHHPAYGQAKQSARRDSPQAPPLANLAARRRARARVFCVDLLRLASWRFSHYRAACAHSGDPAPAPPRRASLAPACPSGSPGATGPVRALRGDVAAGTDLSWLKGGSGV
jgi:hypothetical protein